MEHYESYHGLTMNSLCWVRARARCPTLYDNSTYDVNLLCDKFAKYEMQCRLADAKAGKAEGSSDGSLALFGQQASSSSKGKGKRDRKHITRYGCRKKGHIKPKCPDGEKKDKACNEKFKEKHNKKHEEKQAEKSNMVKGTEANKQKPPSGSLYTAISHNALADTGSSAELFYLDSGASDHIIPLRDSLRAYQKFAKPTEIYISAANSERIYAYSSGTLHVATSANSLG